MAKPIKYNISFTAGDGWSLKLSFFTKPAGVKTARDITNSDFLAQVRRRSSSSEILATMTVTKTAGDATLGVNEIFLSLTDVQTREIARDGVWDLQEIESGGTPQTKLTGIVHVWPDISRVS